MDIDKVVTNASITTVSVLRDGQWKKIPRNFVVEGDIIGLILDHDTAPVKIQCLEPSHTDKIFEHAQLVTIKQVPKSIDCCKYLERYNLLRLIHPGEERRALCKRR